MLCHSDPSRSEGEESAVLCRRREAQSVPAGTLLKSLMPDKRFVYSRLRDVCFLMLTISVDHDLFLWT
jgi:hypothetical protein